LNNIQRVKVFIARPKGAIELSEKLKEVFKRLEFKYIDLDLAVYCEKSFLPGTQKSQSLINKFIKDEADIFISICDEDEGKGIFKKELEIAVKASKQRNLQIVPFFKEGRETPLRDLFKYDDHKYAPYKDETDFVLQAQPIVINLLDSLNLKKTDEQINHSPSPSGATQNKELGLKTETIQDEIKRIIDKSSQPDEYEHARLFLYAAASLYNRRLGSETIGNHELHLLYLYKERVDCVGIEGKLIFRTLLADKEFVKVGWYWINIIGGKEGIPDVLAIFANRDQSAEVRAGALSHLKLYWDKRFYSLLEGLVDDESNSVVEEVLRIADKHTCRESLAILEKLYNHSDKQIKERALAAKIRCLSKLSPHRAIKMLIQDQSENIYYRETDLIKLFRASEKAELDQLIHHNDPEIRCQIIFELYRRKKYEVSELIKLKEDSNWKVRYFALNELITNGGIVSVKEIHKLLKDDKPLFLDDEKFSINNLIMKVLNLLKNEELEKLITWIGLEGRYAYEILGKRSFKKYKKRICADIEDDFSEMRKEYTEIMSKSYPGLDKYILEEFMESAFRILLQHGTRSDVKLARMVILKDKVKLDAAFEFLKKFGSQKDSEILLEAALSENFKKYGGNIAIEGAISLDKKGKYGILRKLLDSNNQRAISITLAICYRDRLVVDCDLVKTLLKSDDSNIRESAVIFLSTKLRKKELEIVMGWYHENGTYYYDVISMIDNVLYAPIQIRRMTKTKVVKKMMRWLK
jgi:hypothetical protein